MTAPLAAARPRTARRRLPVALAVAALLAGCSGADEPLGDGPGTAVTSAPATSPSAAPATGAAPSGLPVPPGVDVARTVTSGLDVPWGLAFLADGSALVAERDSGRVVRVTADGRRSAAGSVPGVRAGGEGGLLGLAVPPASGGGAQTVFAYLTSDRGDNRVVRMPWSGDRLGAPTTVLTGIPAAGIHNGGRMVVGPDRRLYIGTGDASQRERSQDRDDLGGKILRLELDGSVPADNPLAGSPVYSWGHRNVQGLAFDDDGQLWATEFGQNTFDELNRIVRGGNYGWPEVEGTAGGDGRGFLPPAAVWATSDASPSGLAIVDGVAYMAALRGERLWQIPLAAAGANPPAGRPVARLTGDYGRFRTVERTPAGDLWLTTSNRDSNGDPRDGDDRILQLRLG